MWDPVHASVNERMQCRHCEYIGCDWAHIAWECGKIEASEDADIDASNHLMPFAQMHARESPMFWLRSLFTLDNYEELSPPPSPEEALELQV